MFLRRFIPRFRFSLRTMMIVVTLFAIIFGVWVKRYYDLEKRYQSRYRFVENGCRNFTRYRKTEYVGGPPEPIENVEGDWLFQWDRFWFGSDYADPVVDLDIADSPAIQRQVDWSVLRATIPLHSEIEKIAIDDTDCTNNDLQFLSSLPKLKSLYIVNYPSTNSFGSETSKLSDGFILHILSENQLSEVDLFVPKLSSLGLQNLLNRSPNIEKLTIPACALNAELVQKLRSNQLIEKIGICFYTETPAEKNLIDLLRKGNESQEVITFTSIPNPIDISDIGTQPHQ